MKELKLKLEHIELVDKHADDVAGRLAVFIKSELQTGRDQVSALNEEDQYKEFVELSLQQSLRCVLAKALALLDIQSGSEIVEATSHFMKHYQAETVRYQQRQTQSFLEGILGASLNNAAKAHSEGN